MSWAAAAKSTTWTFTDTYTAGPVVQLSRLLRGAFRNPPPVLTPKYLYGYHFLFNTQDNRDLGPDGYDNYQAPKAASGDPLYTRRMWVGGSLFYESTPPAVGSTLTCTESISAVRCLGPNAFVTSNRVFTATGPVMREVRTLLYTNEPFAAKSDGCLGTTDTGASLRFTRETLLRYGQLTQNLHRIHYDLEYCLLEGLAGVVVSGPILVLAILYYFTSEHPELLISTFKYKNTSPCYADQELRLEMLQKDGEFLVTVTAGGNTVCSGTISTRLDARES